MKTVTKSIRLERRVHADTRQAKHNLLSLEQKIQQQLKFHNLSEQYVNELVKSHPINSLKDFLGPKKELLKLLRLQKTTLSVPTGTPEDTSGRTRLTAEQKADRKRETQTAKKQIH